jgi:hypothetical protein
LHHNWALGLPMASNAPCHMRHMPCSEQQCDAHVHIFQASIGSAGRMPGQGFAAIKLTALGNPQLLERVSAAIRQVQRDARVQVLTPCGCHITTTTVTKCITTSSI